MRIFDTCRVIGLIHNACRVNGVITSKGKHRRPVACARLRSWASTVIGAGGTATCNICAKCTVAYLKASAVREDRSTESCSAATATSSATAADASAAAAEGCRAAVAAIASGRGRTSAASASAEAALTATTTGVVSSASATAACIPTGVSSGSNAA